MGKRHVRNVFLSIGLTSFLILFELLIISFAFLGCAKAKDSAVAEQEQAVSANSCVVTYVLPPVSDDEFSSLYQGRSFYADGNHLGHDISLQEGTRIHPIACGKIRVFRSATGYGQLVVVLEHELPYPVTVTNGVGEQVKITRFLSIYGHLRTSRDRKGEVGVMNYTVEDVLHLNDVVGYVDRDATNGDGAEHVHLGVRLQAMDEAKAIDVAWFRGYDMDPSQRKWFADPVVFLSELQTALGNQDSQSVESNDSEMDDSEVAKEPPTTDVPLGQVQFVYQGPLMSGIHELHGTWSPPGARNVPWGPEATVQCPDIVHHDSGLECLLAMPSGVKDFYFTVKLPDGSWWGDMSYDPKGGQGKTIGDVTLRGPYGEISYEMVNNGTGPDYYNGYVSTIP